MRVKDSEDGKELTQTEDAANRQQKALPLAQLFVEHLE